MQHIDLVWLDLLKTILTKGETVQPRGQMTWEIPAHTTVVDMSDPVISIRERELGYKFMAAEAHWILNGDNRVSSIAPYSKKISTFSDDGVRFFGAYGPKVMEQMSYVVRALGEDVDSRQAVMTIWRERPHQTKDVPCTIALQFMIRDGKLNCHATMRSSDAWLGWVYDTFNFSMIAWAVLLELRQWGLRDHVDLDIGKLYLTAASQHLYSSVFDDVRNILDIYEEKKPVSEFTSMKTVIEEGLVDDIDRLIEMLHHMRVHGINRVIS